MTEEDWFQTSARALAEEARGQLAVHPSPDELLAYQRHGLSPAGEDRIQEHLSLCPDCIGVILNLESFPEVEPMAERRLPAARIAAAWDEFREKAGTSPPTTVRSRWLPRPMERFLSSRGLAYALAGCLLAAAVGLFLQVGQLRHTVGELQAPRINVSLGDLVPAAGDRTRGQGVRPQVVQLPAGSDSLLLLLNLADFRSFPGYLLEIEDTAGRIVWSRSGLARSPDGNFTLEVPRGFLRPGVHRLRLYGLAASDREPAREPLVEYRMELIYE
jgi:hypothetical protein